jgi:hypothetical protein
MRTIFALLLMTLPAVAQVHCDPKGCITIERPDLGNPRTPRPGETAAQYGLRLYHIRRDNHAKYQDERVAKPPQVQE